MPSKDDIVILKVTEHKIAIIFQVLNGYGNDDTVTRLLDENDFFFAIILNPDGYEYTWTTVCVLPFINPKKDHYYYYQDDSSSSRGGAG